MVGGLMKETTNGRPDCFSARSILGVIYPVLGFFMLTLHAATLDAPTLVYREYSENFIVKPNSKFKGQPVMSLAAVRQYLDENMKQVTPTKAERLSRLVVKLAREHNIPAGLILSVIKVESNFQPWAVSPRGALGLMQLMPDTGEWLAEREGLPWEGPVTLLDEEKNMILGVRYLAYLKTKYGGDLRMMLSAYNRGPAKVDQDRSVGREMTLEYYHKVKQFVPKLAEASNKG